LQQAHGNDLSSFQQSKSSISKKSFFGAIFKKKEKSEIASTVDTKSKKQEEESWMSGGVDVPSIIK